MGLDLVELIMAFEEEFGVRFDDIDAKNSITPLHTVAALIPFMGCGNDTVWEKQKKLKRVIEMTSEQLGIPVEEIRPLPCLNTHLN